MPETRPHTPSLEETATALAFLFTRDLTQQFEAARCIVVGLRIGLPEPVTARIVQNFIDRARAYRHILTAEDWTLLRRIFVENYTKVTGRPTPDGIDDLL